MVAFNADILRVDPGVIAMGDAANASEAAKNPGPASAACQASLASFRTAHMFQWAFAGIVFVLTLALAVLVAYGLYQSISHDANAKAVIAFAGGAASGLAMAYFVKRMLEAVKVARDALKDVGRYCGAEIKQDLV